MTSSAPPSKLAVTCAACQTSIETEYYDVNGNIFCSPCRTAFESSAETPRGIIPLITAGVFGLGTGVVGAAIYYAVIAIAHLEIGVVKEALDAGRNPQKARAATTGPSILLALVFLSVLIAVLPVMMVVDRFRPASSAHSSFSSA